MAICGLQCSPRRKSPTDTQLKKRTASKRTEATYSGGDKNGERGGGGEHPQKPIVRNHTGGVVDFFRRAPRQNDGDHRTARLGARPNDFRQRDAAANSNNRKPARHKRLSEHTPPRHRLRKRRGKILPEAGCARPPPRTPNRASAEREAFSIRQSPTGGAYSASQVRLTPCFHTPPAAKESTPGQPKNPPRP